MFQHTEPKRNATNSIQSTAKKQRYDQTKKRIAEQNTNTILRCIEDKYDDNEKLSIIIKLAKLCDYIADNETIRTLLGDDDIHNDIKTVKQKIINTQQYLAQKHINF